MFRLLRLSINTVCIHSAIPTSDLIAQVPPDEHKPVLNHPLLAQVSHFFIWAVGPQSQHLQHQNTYLDPDRRPQGTRVPVAEPGEARPRSPKIVGAVASEWDPVVSSQPSKPVSSPAHPPPTPRHLSPRT